jgi:hypothetical protein
METNEAAWLENWFAQKMITAPDDGDVGVQTLIQECEAAARADGVLLQRALKTAGYAKLQHYLLDALDERPEAGAAGSKEDRDGGALHGRHEDG